MKLHELMAVLGQFPDGGAEVVVTVGVEDRARVTYVVRDEQGRLVIGADGPWSNIFWHDAE